MHRRVQLSPRADSPQTFLALPSTKREIEAIFDLRASKTDLLSRLGLLIARTAATVDTSLDEIDLPPLLAPSFALAKTKAARSSLEGAPACLVSRQL